LRTEIQVKDEFRRRVNRARLRRVVERALSVAGVRGTPELTLVITDDATIRKLNREYRGLEETTDVLSFSMTEGSSPATWPGQRPYLGDVVISYPRAVKQAGAAGHPVQAELDLLAAHGVLHLLGYDHATAKEKRLMWELQDAILSHVKP